MMIKEKYLTFENGKKYNPLSDENSMSVVLIKYQLCHCKIFCNYNSCQFLSGHKNSRFDPMDYTVHGILQARTLEWVAFPFSREFS